VRIGAGRKIAWSPDGTRLAFLSDEKQPQLSVIAAKGGKPKKLTNLTGFLTDPQWSPDGTKIAVLFAENAPGGGGPLEAEPVERGVRGGKMHNERRTCGDGGWGGAKQFAGGKINIYESAWPPEGKTLGVGAAPGPADNNWWIAKLYTMAADS